MERASIRGSGEQLFCKRSACRQTRTGRSHAPTRLAVAFLDPRRPWRAAERRVVLRGFWGRFFIAVEPLAIFVCFATLAAVLLLRHQEGAIFIAPIFAGAALLFLTYAFVLMLSVTRAVFETFGRSGSSTGTCAIERMPRAIGSTVYFVAVLDERRDVLGEWRLADRPHALEAREPWPALVEFTRHGGILRIDGQSTGVLPDDIPPLGIGAPHAFAQAAAERMDR